MLRMASQDDTLNLVRKLGLVKYYPEKITIDKVMSVQNEKEVPLTLNMVPWIILKKLITSDSRARDEVVNKLCSQSKTKQDSAQSVADLLAAFNIQENDESRDDDGISPIDAFLVTYRCCDLPLKQIIVHKMFLCKLALPLLIADSQLFVTLWPLRSIVLTYHSDKETISDALAVELPCHTVSAVRLRDTSFSKSHLLNEILYGNSHKTFHDKHCPNGTAKRKISIRYVEGIWLKPRNESNHKTFDRPILFMNLRGNASNSKVADCLYTISSTVMVNVDVENLDKPEVLSELEKIHRMASNIVLLLGSKESKPDPDTLSKAVYAYQEKVGKDVFEKTKKIVVSDQKNMTEIRTNVRNALSKILEKKSSRKCYEELVTKMKDYGGVIDEMEIICAEGKARANDVFKTINKKTIQEQRKELIPLQGEYWQTQTNDLKEVKNFNTTDSIENKAKVRERMEQHRLRQAEKIKTAMPRFMEKVLHYLYQCPGNSLVADFFLRWLKLLLQEKSRSVLPGLKKQQAECWENLRQARGNRDTPDNKMQNLTELLTVAEIKLAEGQISLENVFREVGQLYEVFAFNDKKEHKDVKENVMKLPGIFALLIVKGYGFEVMDGDAFNIPIQWVRAVLKALCDMIGDKKIFVLSVLGIQSAGKSTLLNTMFGMDLPARAGRCTKGVSLRLVPVEQSTRHPFEFDHILVVDTEGLRAQELSHLTQNRDRELTTLTLGMADVTAIVIKGENIADMKDFIEVAAHAFLRMKITNKNFRMKQKCVFIHNNVSEEDAKQETGLGQQKIIDTLDSMIATAAKEESDCKIRTFKEVINFDESKDIFYVYDLWKGDPPLAPINEGYSEKIQEIKRYLLNSIRSNQHTLLKLSELGTRIEDLWDAILADDFIFCFRNSLEHKAYVVLQRKYSGVKHALEKGVTDWVSKTAEVEIHGCLLENGLDECYGKLKSQLEDYVSKELKKAEEILLTFCKHSNLREFMEAWIQNKLHSFQLQVESFCLEQLKDLENLVSAQKFGLESKNIEKHFEEKCLEQSRQVAKEFKDKAITGDMLHEKWVKMWESLVSTLNAPKPVTQNVEEAMKKALYVAFYDYKYLLEKALEENPIIENAVPYGTLKGSIDADFIQDGDFKRTNKSVGIFKRISANISKKDALKIDAVEAANGILKIVDIETRTQRQLITKFKEQFVATVINIILSGIDQHNKSPNAKCIFTPKFKVKLVLHCCHMTYNLYSNMQRKYEESSSINGKLDKMKPRLQNYFVNMVRMSQQEVIADIFWDTIKALLLDRIDRWIPLEIVSTAQEQLSYMKAMLIKEMLQQLWKEKSFINYMTYIKDPKAYALDFLSDYVRRKWFTVSQTGTTRYVQEACKKSNQLIDELLLCIPDPKYLKPSTMDFWVRRFCEEVRKLKLLGITFDLLRPVAKSGVADIAKFTEVVIERVERLRRECVANYFRSAKLIPKFGISPEKLILQRVWGCEHQCPFCGEPCLDSDSNHLESRVPHTCVQHRPLGLTGYADNDTKLVLESCSFLVQSTALFSCETVQNQCRRSGACTTRGEESQQHKFRQYQKYLPHWDIPPSTEPDGGSKYWCLVLREFKREIEQMNSCEMKPTPQFWRSITVEHGINSLKGNE